MNTSADTTQIHFGFRVLLKRIGTVAQAKTHREDVTREDETLTAAKERR